MGALAVATVRQRVATALAALSGWTESRFAPPAFGRDTAQLVHHTFSVAPVTTAPLDADRRQRVAAGVEAVTPFTVRFAHRLRGDNQVVDFDAALAAEHAVVKAVLSISRIDLHVLFDAVEQRAVSDAGDLFLGAVRFTALHRLALQ
jgi:hypothetical protein